MTYQEQKRKVEDLRRVVQKMIEEERRDFEMMLRRSKDEEEFEAATQLKLLALHAKYFQKKSKEDLENAWKKISSS
jgi:hypothetical protein